jgi:hypothetical protein
MMTDDKRVVALWLNLVSRGVVGFLILLPIYSYAEKFCLLVAENYYEQLYCELKALGQGKQLPDFYDFQKNNEVTQAFLIKRPAAKVGIKLALPRKSDTLNGLPSNHIASSRSMRSEGQPSSDPVDAFVSSPKIKSSVQRYMDQCLFRSTQILCGDERFQLVGNLNNRNLTEGVLDSSNKMGIPVYSGDRADTAALGRYLSKAYVQYVEKMLEIGLGGSTFSYAKFVYLYHDVTAKGIDFSGRFETMFGYLKRDKKNLAVSERLPVTQVVADKQCDRPVEHLLVCDGGHKNYLYLRQH